MTTPRSRAGLVCCTVLVLSSPAHCAHVPSKNGPVPQVFTAASFNLANWGRSDRWSRGRHLKDAPKPESERRAVIAILQRIRPDILAVQEIIRDKEDRHLNDLRAALSGGGLQYSEMFAIAGFDERIQIALFSRFPIKERHALNRDQYDLVPNLALDSETRHARIRRRVERGFIHAVIDIAPPYSIEVFVAHLKSKREFPEYDQPDETGQEIIRRKEAEILRSHLDERLRLNPAANILILGDLNDTMGSDALQVLSGRKTDPVRMFPLWLSDYHRDAWTHAHYPERQYALFDYAIASQGLFNEYSPSRSYVYREPAGSPPELRWDNASDHRPIVAAFYAADIGYTEKQRLEPESP